MNVNLKHLSFKSRRSNLRRTFHPPLVEWSLSDSDVRLLRRLRENNERFHSHSRSTPR